MTVNLSNRELPVASLVDNMYRIVRLIGRGGMGAVYEAEDIRLGRSVALKVLRSDLAVQLQADERFMQEARILAQIRSPFVCTVYSVGATDQNATYIAMEYIDGGSLGDLLDRERWLPTRRALRITQRVCEALIEAHDLGIIHRDLKPDNILLTRLGSIDDYVKVVDLGLAKHIASAGSSNNPRLTQARLVLGTPAYMSPEQATGADVGPSSDLYSLGVILYEMLTGYLPVDGESPQDFLRAHQLQAPVPLSTRRPDLSFPPSVERLCQRVLSKDPTDRPVDAREFLHALNVIERSIPTDGDSSAQVIGHGEKKSTASRSRPASYTDSRFGHLLRDLDERLERAKDQVKLELVGLAANGRAELYETFDNYSRHIRARIDAPSVVRMRFAAPNGRLPMSCLFDEVRHRAQLSDDDSPAAGRRKLLGWTQSLMPERPGRASQIAHISGMFLDVDFPDSPHLSHARAVPEVARIAGGAALADVLRSIVGRGALILMLERVSNLTRSERAFLRRLVRQLGATPVLVLAGWIGDPEDVPPGLSGLVSAGAVLPCPAREGGRGGQAYAQGAQEVLAAMRQLGTPCWPGMLQAALGRPVEDDMDGLLRQGAIQPALHGHFSGVDEYVWADGHQHAMQLREVSSLDHSAAFTWLSERVRERPRRWAMRLSELERQAGRTANAANYARVAGEAMHRVGALSEAIDTFELARQLCLDLGASGDRDGASIGLPLTIRAAVPCLAASGDDLRLSEHTYEAIEALRGLSTLDEQAWYDLGAPLLAAWAKAEIQLGRSNDVIGPLQQQIAAAQSSSLSVAMSQLPSLRMALGDALHAIGEIGRGLEHWRHALDELPLEADFQLMADLATRISTGFRALADGAQAVVFARKALASARLARDLVRESEALRTLAVALRDVGELDDAEAQLGEALNALGRVDRPGLAAEVSVLLAQVLMQRGATDEADAALAKACRSFAALKDLAGLAAALRRRGQLQLNQGIYARALAFAEESNRQAVLAGEGELQVQALLLAARAAAAAGDFTRSQEALESAFYLVPGRSQSAVRADCLVTLGDLLEARVLTSDRDVVSLLNEAAELYESIGHPQDAAILRRRVRAMRDSDGLPMGAG